MTQDDATRSSHGPADRSAILDWFALCSPPLFGAATALLLVCGFASSALADRIILRNLKTYNEPVANFDEDGLKLQSGTELTWDEVEAGTVAAADQERFDKTLAALGEPLYRIRQRLTTGDYEGVLESAEKVYPVYAQRSSPTAYMVFQALMWGRLEAGRREAAVEPYLRCLEYLRARAGRVDGFPGDRRLRVDLKTGLTPELALVWFDKEAAAAALDGVRDTVRTMKAPRPVGAYLMYATLALTAGNTEEAQRFLATVDESDGVLTQLRDIALAQQEVQSGEPGAAVDKLANSIDKLSPGAKPLAQYWIARAHLNRDAAPTQLDGVLEMLRVPALYGDQFPELAAAGLYDAMNRLAELGDNPGSVAVRRELLTQYPGTVYAKKVKAASALP
ncbi:MAG: hypothetical protein RIC55_01330 [Pirellulaceae bacterium]